MKVALYRLIQNFPYWLRKRKANLLETSKLSALYTKYPTQYISFQNIGLEKEIAFLS